MGVSIENYFLSARKLQFGLNFGFLLLGKCIPLLKTAFLVLGICSLVWILASYCSESAFHCRKPLSCCPESAIRFGSGFLTARKVHFTLENHFLVARKVQFGLDRGFLLLGKCISLSKPLSCCSESEIRFGLEFLSARKV